MTSPRRRRFLLALGLSVLVVAGASTTVYVARAYAQQAPAPQEPSEQEPAQQPAAEGGSWDFEEEEEDAPTWADDIRAQTLDIAMVAGFSVLAFVSFFRKSVRLKYVTLVAAVLFLGFYKSLLISIVNVFGLMGGNLPIFRYNLAWYLLAAITVVSTVLWGRVYCGRICAFGAFTQLVDAILPDRWRVNIPRAIERRASWIKYGILAGVIAYFLITRDPLIYPVRRTVLDVRAPSAHTRTADAAWLAAHHHRLRSQRLLPLLVSARSVSRNRVEPDRLSHQALVRVQHLPHLREDVRVGGDSRAEDRDDGMRSLR